MCMIVSIKGLSTFLQDGFTAIHIAVKNGHTNIVQYLLETGVNPRTEVKVF